MAEMSEEAREFLRRNEEEIARIEADQRANHRLLIYVELAVLVILFAAWRWYGYA